MLIPLHVGCASSKNWPDLLFFHRQCQYICDAMGTAKRNVTAAAGLRRAGAFRGRRRCRRRRCVPSPCRRTRRRWLPLLRPSHLALESCILDSDGVTHVGKVCGLTKVWRATGWPHATQPGIQRIYMTDTNY